MSSTGVATPSPAATVLALRPSAPSFEVLMVERTGRGQFGGLMVFPGGALEEIDHDLRSAALRELAEETGLVALRGGVLARPSVRGQAFYRQLEAAGETLAIDDLVMVSRWVTPEPARKRFDTSFYILPMVDPPPVVLDVTELVSHSWVTPSEALEKHESGAWRMILPTLAHLRWLARRASIEEAVASAFGADGRTLITPRVVEDGSLLPVYLPGDER